MIALEGLRSAARVTFLEPDGTLWLVDGRGATWRVDTEGGQVIDRAAVDVFLADGDVRRGVRGGRLVERTRNGAFTVVDDAPDGLLGGFGALAGDHWLFTSAGELVHAVDNRFVVHATGLGDHLLGAAARSADDVWFVSGYHGPHAQFASGAVRHWDGDAWVSDPAAPGAVYDVALGQPSGVWAAAYEGLFDGTDGWTLAAPGSVHAVAATADGAAWAAYTGYPVGRFFDGAWSSLAHPPLQTGRMIADGESVWMGTERAEPEPSGLVRFDVDQRCGGGVHAPRLALWGEVPIATYTSSFETQFSEAEDRIALRREGGWEEWSGGSIPFVHDDAPWLAVNAVLFRLDDADWSQQAWFGYDALVLATASVDGGPLYVATWHVVGWPDETAPGRVFRLEDGAPIQELEAPGTRLYTFVEHEGDVWVSGSRQEVNVAWRREDDGSWTELPTPPGWLVAAEADGTLWAAEWDVWRGDGETWEPVCPGTFPDVDGDGEGSPPRTVIPTDDGVYIGNSDGLFLWDGTSLRRVLDAPVGNGYLPPADPSAAIVDGTLWLVTDAGLMEGPLPPPGDVVPCLD